MEITVKPGRYHYKFVVDGEMKHDEDKVMAHLAFLKNEEAFSQTFSLTQFYFNKSLSSSCNIFCAHAMYVQ